MEIREGTVVVVTGASAGVGRAAALAFGRRGAKVALLARDPERLAAARREVEQAGGAALDLPLDVSDPMGLETAAERVEAELGPIDVWVNNAMVTVFAPLQEVTPEEFRRVTEVTYHGTVWGTMAALRRMRPRNRGTVVQVGSAVAHRSLPLQAAYSGAKHAARGFTDAVRSELLHDGSGVRLCSVELPALNTPQFDWCQARLPHNPQPLGTVYQPEVAAEAIVEAARGQRREIHVTLSTALTIWGDKLFPELMDHVMAQQAVTGQQSTEPTPPERPSNLWQPVPGPYAAHGRFDHRARPSSRSLWLELQRPTLPAPLLRTGLAIGAAALGLVAKGVERLSGGPR